MIKRILFLLIVATTAIQAQVTVTPVNPTTQVFTTLELNRNLNAVPTFTFNRNLMQPILANPGFVQKTTIVIEQTPLFTPPLNPINNKCEQRKDKVQKPFVPTYIHLNLNKQ